MNTPAEWAVGLRPSRLGELALPVDHRWRLIRRLLAGPILDVGCGRGEWVRFLHRRGYEAIGLDYSPEMIEANRARTPACRWLVGRSQAIPLPDVDWRHHLVGRHRTRPDGPQAALLEFHRVTKPGGAIVVTVPVDSPFQRAASKAHFPAGTHFFQYFFTADELVREVRQAGFDPVATSMSTPHPSLIWPERRPTRLQRVASLLAPRKYANMVYCVGRRL
jgi:ubiquinone/menaquinone biosynthesis C-methylase UbiE